MWVDVDFILISPLNTSLIPAPKTNICTGYVRDRSIPEVASNLYAKILPDAINVTNMVRGQVYRRGLSLRRYMLEALVINT